MSHEACTGKVKYSFKFACRAVRALRDNAGVTNAYVYRCHKCGKHHVGKLSDPLNQQPMVPKRIKIPQFNKGVRF